MTTDGIEPDDPRRFEPSRSPADTQTATVGRRCIARLIDGVVVLVVAMLIVAPLDAGQRLYVTAAVFALVSFAYFVVYESTQGSTPGKKVVGICVLGPDSAPRPTAKESAIRNAFTLLFVLPYVGSLLSLTAYLLLLSTITGNEKGQGLHDRWAGGTRVVKSNRLEF